MNVGGAFTSKAYINSDITGRLKAAARRYSGLVIWVLPAAALVGTLLLWSSLTQNDARLQRQRMQAQSERMLSGLDAQLSLVGSIMHSCAGLFKASDNVTRAEWNRFVEQLSPAEHNPGVQSVGFVEKVTAARKEDHVREVRAGGFPDYQVRPEARRPEYFPIVYQAPPRSRGRRTVGYDLASEPVMLAAMANAMVSGEAESSGPVMLTPKAEGTPLEPGFLIFMPLYAEGRPLDTRQRRREALEGYVYASLRAGEMAAAVAPLLDPGVHVRIYDAGSGAAAEPIYDSLPGRPAAPATSLSVESERYGRKWRFEFRALPSFSARDERSRLAAALAGLLITALLVWLVLAQTARARAMALFESTAQDLQLTQFTVDHCGTPVFLVRPDGTFHYVNRAACGLLGYSYKELLGLTAPQINPRYISAEVWAERWADLKRTKQEVYESELLMKDGRRTPVEITANYLRHGDKELKCVFIHDLSERKRMEEELKRGKTAAEAGSRAKGVFLASMSHEIRTPLNAILGFSQLMGRDPAITPRQLKQIETINRSGRHLLALINDILEMSRIEAGRAALNPAPFDLGCLLDDLEAMFRQRAEAKGLRLTVVKAPGLPRFALGDEGKLRQILVNLLGNAFKFTSRGGIALRASFKAAGKTGRFTAEVADSGPGMTHEESGRLFSPFEQASAGKAAGGGTGLGLAISREYARLMGGDITVESRPGEGSAFSLEVSLEESAGAAAASGPEARRVKRLAPGQPPCRVLIADDKEDNREFLGQLLRYVGFEVRQAVNGEEAVRAFGEWRPRLVLMDIKMPVMDGYEATLRIRSAPGGKDAKIIVLSASAIGDARGEALNNGADDYLAKPFREAELFDKVRALLGVAYDYDEPPPAAAGAPPPVPGELLAGLPADLRERVRAAARGGDFDRLAELAAAAESADRGAAAALRGLAARYDAKGILDLLGPE